MRMKLFFAMLWMLSFVAPLYGQGGNVNAQNFNVLPAAPVSQVVNVNVNQSQPGTATYFYWIVSNNSSTFSQPAGPFVITNSPNTLSAAANNKIVFTPVSGVAGYDVLRTATSVVPSGACNCAVVINTGLTTVTDISNTLLSYTVNAMGAQYTINNSVVGGIQTLLSCYLGTCGALGGVTNGANISANGLFNVKNYGAVGDTRYSVNCTTASSSKTVTNTTDTPWTAADVGKFIEIVNTSQGTAVFTAARKITGFTSSSSITLDTLQDGPASPGSNQACKWFTADDTTAFQNATAAAKAALANSDPNGIPGPVLAYSSAVIVPPGGYTVHSTAFQDSASTTYQRQGVSLLGSPGGGTIIYPTTTFSGLTDAGCTATLSGVIDVCGTDRTRIKDIYVEGSDINFSAIPSFQGMVFLSHVKNVDVEDNTIDALSMASSSAALWTQSVSGVIRNNYIQNPGGGVSGETACEISGALGLYWYQNVCSNHAVSLIVNSSGSRGSTAGQLNIVGGVIDECSAGPCFQIAASIVNLFGGVSYGGTPEIMTVDGTSSVYFSDWNIQVFGSPATNVTAVAIASGGFVESTGSTLVGNGTSPIISGPASATFVDDGGNTYLNCLSGTCAAVTAATYATKGFTGGIIPKASVTHTPNTCYDVTSPAVLASTLLCNQLLDQNYQILNMSASSTTTTACTAAPTVTISDGVQSASLQLTTAKSAWKSTVDVYTGALSVFAAGNTLTVTYDTNAGTCATPPTNLAVSFVLQSVLNF
jgi:hypothetical protein